MSYELIVEHIKNITGINVPVYFNNHEANCSGSPYFGLGEHTWDICPDDTIFDAFFEPIDFIEQKDLHYYHIGLPTKILRKPNNDYIYKVTYEQLQQRNINIELTEELLEIFIILHEFGHVHHLFCGYNSDLLKYIRETEEKTGYKSYEIRSNGLAGTEEGFRLHKTLETEIYADNFALNYFEEVVNSLKN